MKILWFCNQIPSYYASKLNISTGSGGGWMEQLAQQLTTDNELYIVAPISRRKKLIWGKKAEKAICYAIPTYKMALAPSSKVGEYYEKIIKESKPDVIHIWGTEYVHSYTAIQMCKKTGVLEKTIISIQGMVSVYATHYLAFISLSDFPITVYDILKHSTVRQQQNQFIKRGFYEIKAIEQAMHVIGRTDWDYACTKQINPDVNYHFCNETLRASFYCKRWNIDTCERHSVFLSQSHYPIKGMHLALEAIALLKDKWPDIHLYTTGHLKEENDITITSYQRYLRKKIRALGIERYVSYLGPLSEAAMCERFCKSHVFVSASSIENSPNSVGEAMLLGMPVVSSDVGGVKNMLTHGCEGYIYQADAPYMLAYYIDKIFTNDDLAVELGTNARTHAMHTHDSEENFRALMTIYSEVGI